MKPKDERKIQQIFQATLKLVEANGLAGITMSEIASEAKMATGTLYIYFKNKEDLLNALFSQCRRSAVAIYFKGYKEEEPFKTGFKKIWMNLLRHRLQHFNEAIFLEQCNHSPFITENLKQVSKQLIQPLFELMERGKKEHWIKDADTILLLTHIVGAINNVVRYSHYNRKPLKPDMIKLLFELCWDGIKG